MTSKSNELIGRGHRRYRTGRRLERVGNAATNVGLGAGGLHVASSLIASRGKETRAGSRLAGNMGRESFIPLPQRLRNYAKSTRIGMAVTSQIKRGAKAFGETLGANKRLHRAAIRAAAIGRKARVAAWAPRAIGYGGLAAGIGGLAKLSGSRMIKRGHERHAQGR